MIHTNCGSYKHQVLVDKPTHMNWYRKDKSKISIDKCIVSEIKDLWSKGITTYGCCCGHNIQDSFVNVDEKDIEKMLGLGYIQNHTDKTRKDTFKLKTT